MKKRIISIILAFTLIMGCVVPAFAGDTSSAEATVTESYPFIMIRGMNFGGLTYKAGTDEEQNTFGGVDAKELIGAIFKGIGSAIWHRSWNAFADVVCDYCSDIMGLMACDENGNSKYDVSVESYPLALSNYPEFVESLGGNDEMGIIKKAVDLYGAENVYYYNYDWRLDPLTNAEDIDALVNQALKDSGKSKVNIVCASMGGIETVSYMYRYGYEKINRVVFLSSTVTGTHVTSDLLSGKVYITPEYVNIYLHQMLAKNNKALSFLFDILYKTKVINGVCTLLNDKLVPNLIEEVYDVFLRDVFGTMPSVWALVLPEQYDDCISYMFSGKEEKYAGIIALSKKYQEMTASRDEMLLKAEKDGVSICLVAGYNSSCIPVYTGGGCNGDAILEADCMLGGANVANVGSTLGDNYKAENPNRLSPDKVVDLSNVLFPDSTWAVNGANHVGCGYGSDMSEFLFTLVNAKGKVTVNTFSQYPQFMTSPNGTDLKKN